MLSKQRSFLPDDLATQVYGTRPQSYARQNRRTYGSRSNRLAARQDAVAANETSFRLDVAPVHAAAPVAPGLTAG